MSDTSSASSGGISFGGLLAIVFITLKLTHVIDWSWWWVLSPLWIGAAIVLVIVAVVLVFYIIAESTKPKYGRRIR